MVDARKKIVDPGNSEKHMKYGIRVTKDDGSVEYAYTAKGGYLNTTDDISEITLFAQEESAIKAVKQARKAGRENPGDVIEVVGILPTVQTVTQVPHPPKKSGFLMTLVDNMGVKKFFVAPAKVGSSYYGDLWANFEAATYFKSDLDLRLRLIEIKEHADEQVARSQKELAEARSRLGKRDSWGREVSSWDIQRLEGWVETYESKREAFERIEIELV